jgi:S-adenosyl methyltransferase
VIPNDAASPDDALTTSLASDEPPTDLSTFDTGVAHPARVYDYWLGGKDNFAADREAAERVIAARPTIVRDIRANREVMHRAVAYLADEVGIRQFLDIGTGIPTSPNVHEIAQDIAPESRVVYADNDPIVLAYARALLESTPEGATAYVDADLRESGTIMAEAAKTLDFSQPVALLLVGVLHLINDQEDPYGMVAELMQPLAAGSYLVLTHPASDVHAEVAAAGAQHYNAAVATAQTRRSRADVARLLRGLEIVEPGIVQFHRWHPEPGLDVDSYEVSGWAAVARKP